MSKSKTKKIKDAPHGKWMTREELPPEAIIRLDHAEEWVAWDREMTRAVATGSDPECVRATAIAAGVDQPILEWVPPVSIRPNNL